jgi:hypothetical protein
MQRTDKPGKKDDDHETHAKARMVIHLKATTSTLGKNPSGLTVDELIELELFHSRSLAANRGFWIKSGGRHEIGRTIEP